MVKKGTHKSNVMNGALIDTLVVRPGDLVQVLAKGVMLPTDFVSSDATTCVGGAAPETCGSFQDSDNGAVSGGEQLSQQRHSGTSRSKEEVDYHHASELIEDNPASATYCEWKALAGNVCVASFDWSCSGVCKSVERLGDVHRQCGKGEKALWYNTAF